ncbi:MAG: hypothetical protein ABI662_01485 [Dermatophilaceae bacterium]
MTASPVWVRGSRTVLAFVVGSTLGAALVGALLLQLVVGPNVTAETRLVVGVQSLGVQKVPGYTNATLGLAETYARFITTDTVKQPKSSTLVKVATTVIPDTPVIRVQATAANAKDARSGAAAGAQALIEAVSHVSGSTVEKSRQTFLTKRALSVSAQTEADTLHGQLAATPYDDNLSSAYSAAVNKAALARLEADTSDRILRNQLQAGADQSVGVTVIAQPQVTSAQSRPLLLGALLGAALAVLAWGGVSILRQARRPEPAQVTATSPPPAQ